MSEDESGRRGVLKWIGAVAVVAVAGVGGFLGWQQITRPEVVDTDVMRREDAPDLYTATVRNVGGPGGVLVMFMLRDETNEVLERREREITMAAGEERQVEIEAEPPEGTDEYRFEVEPTDFPERVAA